MAVIFFYHYWQEKKWRQYGKGRRIEILAGELKIKLLPTNGVMTMLAGVADVADVFLDFENLPIHMFSKKSSQIFHFHQRKSFKKSTSKK